jgi:hypothetical protein
MRGEEFPNQLKILGKSMAAPQVVGRSRVVVATNFPE